MELESSTNETSNDLPAQDGSFVRPVPWSFRAALMAVSVLLTANLVASFAIMAIPGFDLWLKDVTHLTAAQRNIVHTEALLLGAVGPAMMFFAIWLVAVRGNPGWIEDLAIKKPRWLAAIGTVVVAQVAIYGFMLTYANIMQAVGIKDASQEKLLQVFVRDKGDLFLTFVLISVLAPISEELVFRGVLYRALRKNTGLMAAAIISGSVFAFSHLSPFVFVPLALMGAVLALIYERTGSIVPPMMLHSLNNSVALMIYYFVVMR